MSVKKARPRGRPPLPAVEKRARNFTFRSRGGLHERLVKAAAGSDRSISEEIEHRLERSFSEGDDALSKALVGNNDTGANLIRWIAFQMQCDPTWSSTPEGGAAMAQLICDYVQSQLVFPGLAPAKEEGSEG